MQIPKTGLPRRTTLETASPMPVFLRTSIAEAAAPTPGKTSRLAEEISSGSRLILALIFKREGVINGSQVSSAVIDYNYRIHLLNIKK